MSHTHTIPQPQSCQTQSSPTYSDLLPHSTSHTYHTSYPASLTPSHTQMHTPTLPLRHTTSHKYPHYTAVPSHTCTLILTVHRHTPTYTHRVRHTQTHNPPAGSHLHRCGHNSVTHTITSNHTCPWVMQKDTCTIIVLHPELHTLAHVLGHVHICSQAWLFISIHS